MRAQVRLFGIDLDAVRMPEAVDRVYQWVDAQDGPCRYIVTPNVDHTILFQQQQALRAAYAEAAMVLADGWPVVAASQLLRRPLPERVAGSDLAPALFARAGSHGGLRIFLLGAAPGVAERAAVTISQKWPAVQVVGTHSPPLGFENDRAENEKILALIGQARPDVLLIGLGAPKQEVWVHKHYRQLPVKAALCIGATIDFLAGERRRAPLWMRRTGLEWLHRVATEPRRLAARYARDAWIFPQLVYREWRKGRSATG